MSNDGTQSTSCKTAQLTGSKSGWPNWKLKTGRTATASTHLSRHCLMSSFNAFASRLDLRGRKDSKDSKGYTGNKEPMASAESAESTEEEAMVMRDASISEDSISSLLMNLAHTYEVQSEKWRTLSDFQSHEIQRLQEEIDRLAASDKTNFTASEARIQSLEHLVLKLTAGKTE